MPPATVPSSSRSWRLKRFLPVILAGTVFVLTGCAKDIDQRGNLPTKESLAQLAIGEQTRQDVQGLLGTPATTAIFTDETWFYISSHTTQYAFYKTHELDRTIFVITFDERGILKSVNELDMKNGNPVQVASRETPTKGREYSLIQQLLGNIGRFSAPTKAPGPE